MTSKEKYEIIERLSQLSTFEQFEFIEGLVRSLHKAFTAHAALERAMAAMAADMQPCASQ